MASGRQVRAAARVQIRGARPQTVTLSFGNVQQRERFLRALEYQCAAAPNATAA
jgi:hypothetical protein